MTIIEYCTEEVGRQGHDTRTVDGLTRVSWMLHAWCYALRHEKRAPSIDDTITLATRIEREKNSHGPRRVGVRVGNHIGTHPENIRPELEALFDRIADHEPLDFYRKFETIHPFIDGNGRTGKVLLNWVNGTLNDPIFPPNDFWGHWIQNP